MKYIPIIILGLVLLIVGAGIFFFLPDNEEKANSQASGKELGINTSKEPSSAYTLEMSNYKYSPNLISVNAGDIVTIQLVTNEGMHDFVIDDLKVQSNLLSEGEEQIISIAIPEDASGKTFDFYCSIRNHRELGMEGIIQVN